MRQKGQATAKSAAQMVAAARRASRLADFTAIALPCLVLTGWVFGIECLKRVFPGFTQMNPVTACRFVVAGVSLLLSDEQRINPTRRAWTSS